MKKLYIGLGAAVIVAVSAFGIFSLLKKDGAAPNTPENTFVQYGACDLLTKDKAAQILNTSATLGQEPSPTSSQDIRVTNCLYNNGAGDFKDTVSVSVLARSPLTQAGAASNEDVFADTSIVGSQRVEGYGEKATWNNNLGQLNILKDKNWIIITFGKAQPSARTLEDAKRAADSIIH